MQFFGRISMSLYLSHEPLMFYLETAVNGKYERELGDDFESEVFRYLPKLFVPIHIIVSVILASIITIGFEEPIRKKLKQWIQSRQKSKHDYQTSHSGQRGID